MAHPTTANMDFEHLYASPETQGFEYSIVKTRFDANTTDDPAELLRKATQQATRTPIILAVLMSDDTRNIYFLHRPTQYAGDLSVNTSMDGKILAFQGNKPHEIATMQLDDDHTFDTVTARAHNNPETLYNLLTEAAPQAGPHAANAAGTGTHTARRTVILPSEWAAKAIAMGKCNPAEFYRSFLEPIKDDQAEVTKYSPVFTWWQLAATLLTDANNKDLPSVCLTVHDSQPRAEKVILRDWQHAQVTAALAVIQPPPPPPTHTAAGTDAIVTAIENLDTTLKRQYDDCRADEEAKEKVNYTTRFGRPSTTLLLRYTGAEAVEDVPEFYQDLARNHKQKSHDAATLRMAVDTRARDSNTAVSNHTRPVVTTKLLDIFRELDFVGQANDYSKGLTPFAAICQAHPLAQKARDKLDMKVAVESGSTGMSASDAEIFAISDARFPANVHHGSQKLQAHSLLVDLAQGQNHPLACKYRQALVDLVPLIHHLPDEFVHDPTEALRITIRIMYWIQLRLFRYWDALRTGKTDPALPKFGDLIEDLSARLYHTLPNLPDTWFDKLVSEAPCLTPTGHCDRFGGPSGSGGRGGARGSDGGGRTGSDSRQEEGDGRGRGPDKNLSPDKSLRKRWEACEHETIKDIFAGAPDDTTPPVPKVGNLDVCFTWALKGKCQKGCLRAKAHKTYADPVVKRIHSFLDACNVPKSE